MKRNNKRTYVTFVSFKLMVFIGKTIGRLNTQACGKAHNHCL